MLFVTDSVIEPFPEPEELLTVSQLTSLDAVQFTLDVMVNEADVWASALGAQLEELMESWGTKAACVTVIVLVWL